MNDKILGLKNEVWFIFFFLAGSLIFFDITGINFLGITGAQTIPVDQIAGTFGQLYDLIIRGFLGSAITAVNLNGVLAIRLVIVLFIFSALSVSGLTKKYEKYGSVLAFLLALLIAAFTPQNALEFIRGLLSGVMGLIGLALIALVFWGMHKWKTTNEDGSINRFMEIFKGVVYLLILLIIVIISNNLDQSYGQLVIVGTLGGAIAMGACLFLAGYHIIWRGIIGGSGTVSGAGRKASQLAGGITQAGGLGPVIKGGAQKTGRFFYNPGAKGGSQSAPQSTQNQNLDKQLKSIYAQLEKDYNGLIKSTPAIVAQQDLSKIDGMIRTILSELSKFGSLSSQIPDQGTQNSINAQLQIIAGKLNGIRNMMSNKAVFNPGVLKNEINNKDIINAIKGIGNYI